MAEHEEKEDPRAIPKRIFHHPSNPVIIGAALLHDAGLIRPADDRLSFNFCHFSTGLWLPDVVTHAIAAITVVLTLVNFFAK